MVKVFLIIEDNKLLRALKKQFEEMGFQVHTAQKMGAVENKLKSYRPHVVMAQAKTEHIDGLEVARLIDKKSTLPKIILLKTDSGTLDSAELMKLRVDKVIQASAVDKMVEELSALRDLNQHPHKRKQASSQVIHSDKRVPEARLHVSPGRGEKYTRIIHASKHKAILDSSGKFNSARVADATKNIKNESEVDAEQEDLRQKFTEALHTPDDSD